MSERGTGEVNSTSLVSCVFHNNTKPNGCGITVPVWEQRWRARSG